MTRETPDYAHNVSFLGYSDQAGRGDGLQVMVWRDHAIVAHMFSNGFTSIDVSDPRNPRPVSFTPAPPPGAIRAAHRRPFR